MPLEKEASCCGERQSSSGLRDEASKGIRWITWLLYKTFPEGTLMISSLEPFNPLVEILNLNSNALWFYLLRAAIPKWFQIGWGEGKMLTH